ncbi:MAG: hypothetical protein WD749_03010 [Phycisphaerales bacterium]
MTTTTRSAAAVVLLCGAAAGIARAQSCPYVWHIDPIGNPGIAGTIRGMAIHTDASGTALYVAGPISTAGGLTANRVARWNGQAWSALGMGLIGPTGGPAAMNALASYNDGTGPALYATGNQVSIAGGGPSLRISKWDGTSWSALGDGLQQGGLALGVFNDGTGPALYVGGSFTSAGNIPGTAGIARWNGTAWSSVGGGLSGGSCNVLYAFNDGAGEALYAGGQFTMAGATPAQRLAKWNGAAWAEVGGGISGQSGPLTARVNTMIAFDDGTGTGLYVGGAFATAGATSAINLARWRGGQWSEVGGGTDNNVIRSAVFDDGRGPALYIGGAFITVGGPAPWPVNYIGRWDGEAWEALGSGISHPSVTTLSAMVPYDDGSGLSLFVGGGFTTAGGQPTNNIARWGCAPPPACYPNCDQSTTPPVLNVADFGCFLTRYAAGEAYANCDESTQPPVLNVADFGCFLTKYAAGCP